MTHKLIDAVRKAADAHPVFVNAETNYCSRQGERCIIGEALHSLGVPAIELRAMDCMCESGIGDIARPDRLDEEWEPIAEGGGARVYYKGKAEVVMDIPTFRALITEQRLTPRELQWLRDCQSSADGRTVWSMAVADADIFSEDYKEDEADA